MVSASRWGVDSGRAGSCVGLAARAAVAAWVSIGPRWLLVAAALTLASCTEHTRAEAPPPTRQAPVRPAPEPEEPPPPPPRTVVWLGGDVLVSEAMRRNAAAEAEVSGTEAESFARMMQPIAPWFERDPQAFVMVNLESPVATRRNQIDRSTWGGERLVAIPLNAPSYTLEALKSIGVDGLMLSNNHALDQGEEGLVETLEAARQAGFATTGAGLYPRVTWPITVGEDGARVTLVPFYDGHRSANLDAGTPALADLNDESIAAFGQLRPHTELLVPVVHVLGEAVDTPKPRWREWATQLAEAGADVIVVHGTHVPLPVERLQVGERQVPIVWGLGNFVGDMARQATPRRDYYRGMPKDQNPMLREGLLLRIELTQGLPVQLRFLPTWMNDDRYIRYWHGFERPYRFRLSPVAACGQPIEVPDDWQGELREEVLAWITGRREHLITHVGLDRSQCVPGQPALLQARALQSPAAGAQAVLSVTPTTQGL